MTSDNRDATVKARVREAVAAGAERLRACTSHVDLYRYAAERGLHDPPLFAQFTAELREQLDIDYQAMRGSVHVVYACASASIAARATTRFSMSAAADRVTGKFAVCGRSGDVIWHDTFDRFDHDLNGLRSNQCAADTAAAHKAIFLASRARCQFGADAAALRLTMATDELDTAALQRAAFAADLTLELNVRSNPPALPWCRLPGSRQWLETDLPAVLETE